MSVSPIRSPISAIPSVRTDHGEPILTSNAQDSAPPLDSSASLDQEQTNAPSPSHLCWGLAALNWGALLYIFINIPLRCAGGVGYLAEATAYSGGKQIGKILFSFKKGLLDGFPIASQQEGSSTFQNIGKIVGSSIRNYGTGMLEGLSGPSVPRHPIALTQRRIPSLASEGNAPSLEPRIHELESSQDEHISLSETSSVAALENPLLFTPQHSNSSLLSDSETSPNKSSFDVLLLKAGTWIHQGVRTQATSWVLSGIAFILAQAAKDIPNEALANQINDMIAEIERVKNGTGDFNSLRRQLTHIMNGSDLEDTDVRQLIQLHFNGIFEIPIREEPAQKICVKNILLQNISATPLNHEPFPFDYAAAIPALQERLVSNISCMVAMQAANQFSCNRLIPEGVISRVISSCERNEHYLVNVRKRFFREIDRLDISYFAKVGAKIAFAFVSLSSNYYLSRFISSLLVRIEEASRPTSYVKIQEQHTKMVKNANEFLCVLKGTLRRVNNDPRPTSSPETMTENELADPIFNHGFTSERLYAEATYKAIETILPPLGWHSEFQKMASKAPWVLRGILYVFSPLIYLAEIAVDFILRKVLQLAVSQSNVLETIVNRSVSQVYRNGYTHSVNKLFFKQLKQIWQALDESESESSSPQATIANREELKQLVINLYDVLELHRQSRHLGSEPTLLERAKDSLYKISADYCADALALIIDKAKNTFLTPELIPSREFMLLDALNSALESNEVESEEDMMHLEREITELGEAILNKAIKTVVHKSFEKTPSRTQNLFERHILKLKTSVSSYLTKMTPLLNFENEAELLGAIAECSKHVLDLQKICEDDPNLSSEARLMEEFYTKPLAEKFRELRHMTTNKRSKKNKLQLIQSIETTLTTLPQVKHINSMALPIFNNIAESSASWIAFKLGKEFFDETWSLIRKPYVWRYGVIHRMLIPFVENN